ncbi:YwmB family TATA-box binding protein [Paenibacillus luteus]|uniref:YwmB family TATA-box binding protein n=1 Tax=Paenibacillus luteus TaxID=2545753 RepID=UPI001375CCF2|nr:YwmB family TATA-box binding protein [Paenibacillus luteus]
MYIPKDTKPVRRRLSAKQRAKQTRIGVILAMLVILLSAGWALGQQANKSKEIFTGSAVKRLQHDLQLLWVWSDEQLRSGSESADWTIRWNVTGKEGAMKELVKNMFMDEKGMVLAKLEQNEGKTVSGLVPAYAGKVSISLIQTDEQKEQLMVLLETNHSSPLTKSLLLKASSSISEQLAQLSLSFTSSMKVQGYTEQKQVTSRMSKLANASLVDRYEDGGTVSETFYTRMLNATIAVQNGNSANYQVAVHKNTDTNNTALTIGIPLISGDYSVSTTVSP